MGAHEISQAYPPHLVPPEKLQLDKVRYGRTIANLCETPLYRPHSFPILKQHEEVQSGSVKLNHLEFVYSYPPHLVPPKKMQLDNDRYSGT